MHTPDASYPGDWDLPVVWLVHQTYRRDAHGVLLPRYDTSGAAHYGTIRAIYHQSQDRLARDLASADVYRILDTTFYPHFNASRDFLLLMGAPPLCAMVAASALAKAKALDQDVVRLLTYHRRDDRYIETPINVPALMWPY